MSKAIINTERAPAAIGPYSQAVMSGGNICFVSGQLPINPATGNLNGTTIEEQTRQSLENIKAVLEEAGMTMKNVVKTTVLLNCIADFDRMNKVYAEYFREDCPGRAAYQAAALPKAALVEIEAVAIIQP